MEVKKIHEDARGEIWAIPYDKDKEITIFTTYKGYARGGCIHRKNDECFVVVKGYIEYYVGGRKLSLPYHAGEGGIVPKKKPHYFIAQEESIVMEWGATIKEKNTKYKRFRKIVEEINLNLGKAVEDV